MNVYKTLYSNVDRTSKFDVVDGRQQDVILTSEMYVTISQPYHNVVKTLCISWAGSNQVIL